MFNFVKPGCPSETLQSRQAWANPLWSGEKTVIQDLIVSINSNNDSHMTVTWQSPEHTDKRLGSFTEMSTHACCTAADSNEVLGYCRGRRRYRCCYCHCHFYNFPLLLLLWLWLWLWLFLFLSLCFSTPKDKTVNCPWITSARVSDSLSSPHIPSSHSAP